MQSPQDMLRLINTTAANGPIVGEFKICCRYKDFGDWLVCDGRELEKEDYPALAAAVVGTKYEVPPTPPVAPATEPTPSTTFKLPNAENMEIEAAESEIPANGGVPAASNNIGTTTQEDAPTAGAVTNGIKLGCVFIYAGPRA
jgi:microcystin-dependent protein